MVIDKGCKSEDSLLPLSPLFNIFSVLNYIDTTSLECRVLRFLFHFQILALPEKILPYSQQTKFVF